MDLDCKQVPAIVTEIMVPRRNGWGHGDQQLNFYCTDPVATMDRFMGQPSFSGKTYMKFERQESEQRPGKRAFSRAGLCNTGLVFQEVQLIDMHSVPLLHLLYAEKSFSCMNRTVCPIYCENSPVCYILHKKPKLNIHYSTYFAYCAY